MKRERSEVGQTEVSADFSAMLRQSSRETSKRELENISPAKFDLVSSGV